MMEKIICFSLGLSQEDIAKGKTSFYALDKQAYELDVVTLTENMLASRVGDTLDSVMKDSGRNSTDKRPSAEPPSSPGGYQYRVVVVNVLEREQVLQVMRSFKAVLPDPQELIFAVITDTARTWTFAEYIGHLAMEHEQMKNRKP